MISRVPGAAARASDSLEAFWCDTPHIKRLELSPDGFNFSSEYLSHEKVYLSYKSKDINITLEVGSENWQKLRIVREIKKNRYFYLH